MVSELQLSGNIGEAEALAAFVRLGLPVYLPFCGEDEVDMVVLLGGRLRKIQCKASRHLSKTGSSLVFRTNHLTTTQNNRRVCSPYEPGTVDYFALYNQIDDELYLVPWSVASGLSISIVIDPAARRQATMHYAADYRLEDMVQRLNTAG